MLLTQAHLHTHLWSHLSEYVFIFESRYNFRLYGFRMSWYGNNQSINQSTTKKFIQACYYSQPWSIANMFLWWCFCNTDIMYLIWCFMAVSKWNIRWVALKCFQYLTMDTFITLVQACIMAFELFCQTIVLQDSYQSSSPRKCNAVPRERANLYCVRKHIWSYMLYVMLTFKSISYSINN